MDTEAKGNDVEQVRENLDTSVEPNETREAEEADGDGTDWEEDSESKASQDTVSDEHSPAGWVSTA